MPRILEPVKRHDAQTNHRGFRPCPRPSFPMLQLSRGARGIGCPRRQRRRTRGERHRWHWPLLSLAYGRRKRHTRVDLSSFLPRRPTCGNCARPRRQRRRSKILVRRAITERREKKRRNSLLFNASCHFFVRKKILFVRWIEDEWISSTWFTC